GRWGCPCKSGGEPPHSKIVGAPTIPKTGSLCLRWLDERCDEGINEEVAGWRGQEWRFFEAGAAGGVAFRNWGGGDSGGDVAARRRRVEDDHRKTPHRGE